MRDCPFNGCRSTVPDHIFACRTHWRSLALKDRFRITDAYAAYQRGDIGIEQLREIQQSVLGNRGVA